MKRWTAQWLIVGAGACAVAAALTWVSMTVLDLEKTERESRAEFSRQSSIRLALWRMDSWLSPRLATEGARPYFEYLAFYPQDRAYTRVLNRIEKGEVLTPSPLLTYRSDLFLLHFQVASGGSGKSGGSAGLVTSPQVPQGNELDLAESGLVTPGDTEQRKALLMEFAAMVSPPAVNEAIGCTESLTEAVKESDVLTMEVPLPAGVIRDVPREQVQREQSLEQTVQQRAQSKIDWSTRAQNSNYDPQMEMQQQILEVENAIEDSTPVDVGPLLAVWLGPMKDRLAFVRRVKVNGDAFVQGFLVDWPRLQKELLSQISDLFPGATLSPVESSAEARESASNMLAAVPAVMDPGPVEVIAAAEFMSPARYTLVLVWVAAIAAVIAGALTLRTSIAYAEKRSRFASTVTHELRTPLTTFQLYSEMLAEEMVKDPEQRKMYLRTLQDESQRLASLVENVLSYSRIEQDRFTPNRVLMKVNELIEGLSTRARSRLNQAGMELVVEMENGGDSVSVDGEAIGQIVFNLVDNAAKYAAEAVDRRVHLSGGVENGSLLIAVRDHGFGVPAAKMRELFKPFERGVDTSGGDRPAPPGVGLGLALCSELARELGGNLSYEAASGGGSQFSLRVPRG